MKQIQREDHQLRVCQFIVCSLITLAIGRSIGFPETPTISISAILSLYIDRGYWGTIRYSLKRVAAQIVMGGLALAAFLPLSSFVSKWAAMVLSVCFSFAIGLTINEKFPYSPLTVSAGDAALIMATGYYSVDPNYYWQRILFCIIGGFVGISAYYFSHARVNRLLRIEKSLTQASRQLLSPESQRYIKSSSSVLAWAKNQLKLWHEDQRLFSSRPTSETAQAEYLTAVAAALEYLLPIKNHHYTAVVEPSGSELSGLFNQAEQQHLQCLSNNAQAFDLQPSPKAFQSLEQAALYLPYFHAIQTLCDRALYIQKATFFCS